MDKQNFEDLSSLHKSLYAYQDMMNDIDARVSAPTTITAADLSMSFPEIEMINQLENISEKSDITAAALTDIKDNVKTLNSDLEKERSGREAGDIANLKYTKRSNLIGYAIGIAGLILALIALFKP